MQYYQITVASKNKKSIQEYFKFINKNIQIYNSTNKFFNKKKKKKFITILKSPHVNKKAQEQFGYQIFTKQLLLTTPNNYQLMLFLKKIEKNLFSDVIAKIKLQLNQNLPEKFKKKSFNPDNFKTFLLKNNISINTLKKKKLIKNNLSFFKKTIKLFQIFDIYGEINRKNLMFR